MQRLCLAMMILAAGLAASGAASAQSASGAVSPGVARTYASPAAPIAGAVGVPAGFETVYLSGSLPDPLSSPAPGTPPVFGTTEQQAESVLTKLAAGLRAQGLTEGDVVKMTVFMAGDPAKDGKMDFAGMMSAYKRHYGTPAQPNRPARSTVQVAALVAPGAMVEIEAVAVRRPR